MIYTEIVNKIIKNRFYRQYYPKIACVLPAACCMTLRAVHQAVEADNRSSEQACGSLRRLSADPLESKENIRLTMDTVMV